MEFKAAICPICGGNLQLPDDRKVLKCMYCGKDVVVQEAIQKAAGPTFDNLLFLGRNAREAGNFQEAYAYFTRVLELDPMNVEGWLCKGESAGWLSTLANFRLDEMMTGIFNALSFSPDDKKQSTSVIGANILSNVAHAISELNIQNLNEFGNIPNVQFEFYQRGFMLLKAYETAHFLDPTNEQVITYMINLCEVQLKCLEFPNFRHHGFNREQEPFWQSKINELLTKSQTIK